MDGAPVSPLNLKRLEKGLFSADESPHAGLEIGDPRLDAITDAAFKSNYADASALAQQAWDDGVRDVRLVGYLLYGYYLAKEVAGLPWLFQQITTMLTTSWSVVGPAKKDKPGDGALNWLFQMLVRHVESHEKAKDEAYEQWLTEEGTAGLTEASSAAAVLVVAVEGTLPTGKCLEKLRNLNGWLRTMSASAVQMADRARREAEATAQEEGGDDAQAARGADGGSHGSATQLAPVARGAITVEGGAPLGLLLRKLKLFGELIERQDLLKAAVVARDIEGLVQAFDPVVFFPKMFVPFFTLMSKNMESLEPAMQSLEMPSYKSLVQLYHADLDAFAES
jgi:hypothetical protein